MSGLEIKASVIIPSFNGARKINHLLDSLLKQTAHEFEIIVVIDGSTDHTIDILSPYHKAFRKFKVILQNNQGRSRCRNNGAKAASADILIFYDDDMIPASDSVEKHLNFHSQFLGILCGDVVEIFGANVSDLQNYKAWLTAKWTSKYAGDFTKMTRSNLFFTAANCSFPKALFLQMNGFDEDLSDAEDYELARRALDRHVPVVYDKCNKAVHNDQIACRSYIRRLREYSAAHEKLNMRESVTSRKRSRGVNLKRLVYRAFAFQFWVWLIDAGVFSYVFPTRLRYALYSVIIHSLAYEYSNVRI